MGLDINPETIQNSVAETSVRTSRRLAQQKIKEEAERRKIDEIAAIEKKSKKMKKQEDKVSSIDKILIIPITSSLI